MKFFLRDNELVKIKASAGATIILIIGNEGESRVRLTREDCDLLIKIPMVGKIKSLNAEAGALLFYEIFSQRQRK